LRCTLKVKLFPQWQHWLHCPWREFCQHLTLIKFMIDMNSKYMLMWWHFKICSCVCLWVLCQAEQSTLSAYECKSLLIAECGLVWKNEAWHNRSTHSPIKRNVLQHKINTKLKPGVVASYDIWPGNGVGLFWFWHFIILSLTYLDTYLQPRTHT